MCALLMNSHPLVVDGTSSEIFESPLPFVPAVTFCTLVSIRLAARVVAAVRTERVVSLGPYFL
ncbi:MAG: hypothetical protein KDI03_17230, partial [Anaerolineae bacterium]|nr:hypothetical protein [Anaerolineae bacterium]